MGHYALIALVPPSVLKSQNDCIEEAVFSVLAPYSRYDVRFAEPKNVEFVEWDPDVEESCWINREGKWTEYAIGGRWSGLLRLKEVAPSARLGDTSSRWYRHPVPPHSADIAKIRDIDWEGYDLEREQRVVRFYTELEAIRSELNKGRGLLLEGVAYPTSLSPNCATHTAASGRNADNNALDFDSDAGCDAATEFSRLSVFRRLQAWSLVSQIDGRTKVENISFEEFHQRHALEFDRLNGITVVDASGWKAYWGEHDSTSFYDRFIRLQDPESYCAVVDFR